MDISKNIQTQFLEPSLSNFVSILSLCISIWENVKCNENVEVGEARSSTVLWLVIAVSHSGKQWWQCVCDREVVVWGEVRVRRGVDTVAVDERQTANNQTSNRTSHKASRCDPTPHLDRHRGPRFKSCQRLIHLNNLTQSYADILPVRILKYNTIIIIPVRKCIHFIENVKEKHKKQYKATNKK